MTDDVSPVRLADLSACFEGAVPAVIATSAADGTPNVTYLSRVQAVDDAHVALSNQFFSKTARNLAENPRASLVLVDPATYDQWRLDLAYERTERRGPVFERLRADVDALAALEDMQDVFRLRAADLYRVLHIEPILAAVHHAAAPGRSGPGRRAPAPAAALAELAARLGRCPDLDALVSTTVTGLAELLGHEHSSLLLVDETGERLYTIASHGYPDEGVGSEVAVGEGVVGMAAARAAVVRVGNVRQMQKYSRSVRQAYEAHGTVGPGREVPVPGLEEAESRIAVPAVALGQVVAVLLVESTRPADFDDADQGSLTVIASIVAQGIEVARNRAAADQGTSGRARPAAVSEEVAGDATHVRFFDVDGSTFLDGDYLIKGVAGRILWSLLGQHERDGRTDFSNREVRLDPNLDLPAFRDNFESRLILLKRRLDEREAPVRIEKTGRGRFRLQVDAPLRLDHVSAV